MATSIRNASVICTHTSVKVQMQVSAPPPRGYCGGNAKVLTQDYTTSSAALPRVLERGRVAEVPGLLLWEAGSKM